MQEATQLFSLKQVNKIYDSGGYAFQALTDINLDIYSGEFIAILGASGSGKSTLLNLIGGMDTITSGDIFYKEIDLAKMTESQLTLYRRYEIGFIFQFYNLVPTLTALENVELACELAKKPLKALEILDRVGIKDFAHRFPSQLSGGQQQRVSIARALAGNPSTLLCDEPTGALDSVSAHQIVELLKEIHRKYHKTVIIVTHNKELAKYADRIITIVDGKLVSDGK